jgi:hypothetical protein
MPKEGAKGMQTDKEKIDDLEIRLANALGQVCALNLAVSALLRTHHDKAAAAQQIHEEYEQMVSSVLPVEFPEPFLEGMEFIRKQLLE